LSSEDYTRLRAEIQNLQFLIKERKNKREPFLSSFADALENTVKKSREWFSEEVKMATRQIGILEQINQNQGFEEEKRCLQTYKFDFDKITKKFDVIIESIREGKFQSLKDFAKKGYFQVARPELIGDFEEMFDVCLNLENLIDGLEQGAKYVISAQRVAEITLNSRK
jgi:hypothetical protein